MKKLDRISRELERATILLTEIEQQERDAIAEHTALDNQLTKLRLVSQEANLQDQLSSFQREGLDLKHQVRHLLISSVNQFLD